MSPITIRLAALAFTTPLLLAQSAPSGRIDVSLSNLRNQRGNVLMCLTRDPKHFPKCDRDPAAKKLTVPAARTGGIAITDLAPGVYAIAAVHDENGNNKLDTALGIPKEGFGFSRNPAIKMGPPKFAEVRFQVGAGATAQAIRMKYLL